MDGRLLVSVFGDRCESPSVGLLSGFGTPVAGLVGDNRVGRRVLSKASHRRPRGSRT
jgi:hypothetical protein